MIEETNNTNSKLECKLISRTIVKRTTASGRRMKYKCVSICGDKISQIGLGIGKNKELKKAISFSMTAAKKNVRQIHKGCSAWNCSCSKDHSIEKKGYGKCGSVKVFLFPAPKGVGVKTSDVGIEMTSLCGISDLWVQTRGQTKTIENYAKAFLNALMNT